MTFDQNKYNREYYQLNGEEIRAQTSQRSMRPEVKARRRERRREILESGRCPSCSSAPLYGNRASCFDCACRNASKRAGYDLPSEGRLMVYASQSGACALCGRFEEDPLKMAVDHDHDTGQVRGLLCQHHNAAIGAFGDDPERLRIAAEYIEDSVLVFKVR